MSAPSHHRLAQYLKEIEAHCCVGWQVCRESPQAAEQWAEQHSEIWPTINNPLPDLLDKALRCCYLDAHLSQTIWYELKPLSDRARKLIDIRPIDHQGLSTALFALWEFAKGYREEIEAVVSDHGNAESVIALTECGLDMLLKALPQGEPQGDGQLPSNAPALNNRLKIQNSATNPYIEWQGKQYHGLLTGTCEAFQKMYNAKGQPVGLGEGNPLRKPNEWREKLPQPLQELVVKASGNKGYFLTIFSPPASA